MNMQRRLILAGCVVALGLGTVSVMAQAGHVATNFWSDPTPVYQKILDAERQALMQTNAEEWAAISPKLLRVVQLKVEAYTVEARSLFLQTGIRGIRVGGGNIRPEDWRDDAVIHGTLLDVPPDLLDVPHDAKDALEKALADGAPMADINAAVAKVQAVLQQKQADMTKAQTDLREVLTPRQVAFFISRGILD
jgi:hypothetical protein